MELYFISISVIRLPVHRCAITARGQVTSEQLAYIRACARVNYPYF